MSGLTITTLAQQIEDLIGKSEQQTKAVTAWLGGSADGGPNNDGRYPFVDLGGREILVPSPASFSDMTSGPAAQASVAKVAAELARDLAKGHADRSDAQRILSEAARGAAVDARNLAQEHRNHAGTHEANARYWAELAQGSGQSSSEDREIVEQLAEQVADNAALAAQDASDAAASAALAATFDPNLYDKKSDNLSASRLTGTLDPARLPSTVFQAPIVASGNIGSLTTAQQSEVRIGSTVVTSDGVFWSFLGGMKTAEASYRAMADTTPPWSSIADKPSFFPSNIVNVAGLQSALDAKSNNGHGHGIADVSGLQAALDAKSADGHTHSWTGILDRPSIFASNIANVAGLQSALDAKSATGHAHAWDTITGKPSTFPATAHLHNITDVNGLLDSLNARAVLGAAVNFSAVTLNTGLVYPDANHTVIKTGPGGSERYWRFDANGTLYALNGGLYTNFDVQAIQSVIVGDANNAANSVTIGRGSIEVRSQQWGGYIDISDRSSADMDFGGRVQYASGNLTISHGAGGNIVLGAGAVYANSGGASGGVQQGRLLTESGTEQIIAKQLTFPSTQNPQDGAAFATLEVRGSGGGYGAWMKFHRPGAYGTYFGMFEDGKWGFGGWSAGGTIYEFWTSKNFDPASRMERYNDGWIQTRDGNERFYFATNGRTYMRSRDGFEWRNNSDVWQAILTNDGVFETKNTISTLGNNLKIRGNSPTIYFKDTDNRSAMIHVNSNRFYVLRGNGNDQEGWSTVPNKGWPMEIDLETNHATFGGSIYLNSEWLRVHGQTGIYWETYGGGWHMTDTGWIRAYGSKGIYTAGQVRGGTVVGESDRRLKTNIAPIHPPGHPSPSRYRQVLPDMRLRRLASLEGQQQDSPYRLCWRDRRG